MNSKKTLHLAALLTLLSFVACKNKDTLQPENTEIELTLEDPNESESDYVFDSTAATNIILKNTSAEITGPGVKLTGSTITITQAGVYNVSGTLSNGQLVIDSADDENVNLLFNGIHITNKTSSAVSVVNAEKVVVKLIENSVNSLTDGTYNTTDEKNATFYSKSDISFFGSGKLVVNANYQDGIVSKDGLIIESGTYEVRAVDDGIRGKDYLIIHNGTFDITAGGDGLAADNDEDAERGYVTIENGNYTINSGADGIQAVSVLTLDN